MTSDKMNVLQKLLGLNDSKKSGQIALICTILCFIIYLTLLIVPFDRKTQGYINLYLFMPILMVGLFNSISVLEHHIKIKDFKSSTFLFALPIPIYVTSMIFKIIINWD